MATEEVNAYGAEVKARDVGVVLLLHVVTLGFYNLYWYHKINRELRDFGKVYKLDRCAKVKPGLAVLAVVSPVFVFVAAIFVAALAQGGASSGSGEFERILVVGYALGLLSLAIPAVSWYRSTKRIQEAQGVVGQQSISGVALAFAYVGGSMFFTLPMLIVPYLVQSDLNKVWLAFRNVDPKTGGSLDGAQLSVGALEDLPEARSWDLSELGAEDLSAIEGFLGDREGLGARARADRSSELSSRIRPKVTGITLDLDDERLLELVYAVEKLGEGDRRHSGADQALRDALS